MLKYWAQMFWIKICKKTLDQAGKRILGQVDTLVLQFDSSTK